MEFFAYQFTSPHVDSSYNTFHILDTWLNFMDEILDGWSWVGSWDVLWSWDNFVRTQHEEQRSSLKPEAKKFSYLKSQLGCDKCRWNKVNIVTNPQELNAYLQLQKLLKKILKSLQSPPSKLILQVSANINSKLYPYGFVRCKCDKVSVIYRPWILST